MSLRNVLIIGGNGFVGSSIANRLANLNVKVTVPTRRRERRRDLLLLPNIEQVEADVHDEATLLSLMAGQDAVINLVGVLHSRDSQIGGYGRDFARAHVELPKKIVAACRKAGVRRLLHMSALNAAPDGVSEYLRSKGDGEALVMAANGPDGLDVTVFRPSVIFGVGDSFLATFARLLRGAPVFPLGYGHAKFQPVFVGDVAECFVRSIEARDTFGKAYDLVGPQVYTLRQLVDYVNGLCGNRCRVVALSEFWALMQAGILSLLPKPPLTPDNLRSMEVDSVRADAVLPFGLTPTPLEAVAPSYILGRAPRVHYDRMRVRAGR
jgi:NADH dehydrogenase